MRIALGIVAVAGLLAGCTSTTVPESGVGFGDYASYVRARERALETGTPAPMAPGVTTPGGTAPAGATPAAGSFSVDRAAAAIDAAEGSAAGTAAAGAPLAAPTAAPVPAAPTTYDPNDPNRPRGNAPAGIAEESGEMARNNAGISDEQDFGAVSSRETIESDAERMARNRAQYTVVQPTAVPTRTGPSGPNIVEFALSTTHAPGTPVYRRSGLNLGAPMAKCGKYASADLAQESFLKNGGPDRDREGLDPDGDGFACGWDPRPFRTAQQ